MRSRTLPAVALLAALLQLSTGCSWAFMVRAPEQVPNPAYPVECTSTKASPVLDTICAGYFVANGIFWAGQKTCAANDPYQVDCYEQSQKSFGIGLSAALAVLCAASAGSGYGIANKCREVKEVNALCIGGDEPACKKLNPAWVPPMKLPAGLAPAAPATAGCVKDTDCKGDRVCVAGACVEPAARPAGQ